MANKRENKWRNQGEGDGRKESKGGKGVKQVKQVPQDGPKSRVGGQSAGRRNSSVSRHPGEEGQTGGTRSWSGKAGVGWTRLTVQEKEIKDAGSDTCGVTSARHREQGQEGIGEGLPERWLGRPNRHHNPVPGFGGTLDTQQRTTDRTAREPRHRCSRDPQR